MAVAHEGPYGFASDYADHQDRMRGYRAPSFNHQSFLEHIKSKGHSFYTFFKNQYSWREFNRINPSEFGDVLSHLEDMYVRQNHQNKMHELEIQSHKALLCAQANIDYSDLLRGPETKSKPKSWLEELQADVNQWLKGVNTLITEPK